MRGLGASADVNDQRYSAKNSFVYQSGIAASLGTSGSTASTFNIDGDSDFFWTKFCAYALVSDDGTTYSAQVLPAVTIIITNTTNGRQYMNAAVPLANIAGTAQLPFILPQVTFFPSKATISIQYQNISDNATYSVLSLSFIGIKAFLAN